MGGARPGVLELSGFGARRILGFEVLGFRVYWV